MFFDGGVEVADEAIDVGAALGGGFSVGEGGVADGVGVEVVVEVDAVDVVAAEDVEDDVECAGAGVGVGGVAPDLGAVAFGDVGGDAGDVVGGGGV